MGVERTVEDRHERCALTAGGDVRRAEVANDGTAGEVGSFRGFTELPGAAKGSAEVPGGRALVVDGLAVNTAEAGTDAVLLLREEDSFAIQLAEAGVKPGELSGRDGVCVHGGKNGGASGFAVGHGGVAE